MQPSKSLSSNIFGAWYKGLGVPWTTVLNKFYLFQLNIIYSSIERRHYDSFPDFNPSSDVTGLELSLLSFRNSSQDLDVYFERAGKFELDIFFKWFFISNHFVSLKNVCYWEENICQQRVQPSKSLFSNGFVVNTL